MSRAADGIEGQENIRRELLDLILLDIRMPETDGFELCRRLKENPATRDIPVVWCRPTPAGPGGKGAGGRGRGVYEKTF